MKWVDISKFGLQGATPLIESQPQQWADCSDPASKLPIRWRATPFTLDLKNPPTAADGMGADH